MASLKIGIMGAGWPSHMHSESLGKIKGMELCAVADVNAKACAELAAKYGPMRTYGDYREMLKKEELDAVVIGLPTFLHYDAAILSLKKGCHVLCEKPPTTNVAEMKRIAALAADKGLTYMFCRQFRYRKQMIAARKAVMAGRIGKVYHGEGKWIRMRGIPWQGTFTNKAKGGGVLLDLGVHVVDNLWFAMGCPKPVEVFSGMHCAFKHLAPEGHIYTADDLTVGMVRFSTGATISFGVSFALNDTGPGPTTDTAHVSPQWQKVKVFGDRGMVDVWEGKIVAGRNKDLVVRDLPLPRTELTDFDLQSREFARAVNAGDEPLNSAAQAVMLMQMLEGLRRSAETGGTVKLK